MWRDHLHTIISTINANETGKSRLLIPSLIVRSLIAVILLQSNHLTWPSSHRSQGGSCDHTLSSAERAASENSFIWLSYLDLIIGSFLLHHKQNLTNQLQVNRSHSKENYLKYVVRSKNNASDLFAQKIKLIQEGRYFRWIRVVFSSIGFSSH